MGYGVDVESIARKYFNVSKVSSAEGFYEFVLIGSISEDDLNERFDALYDELISAGYAALLVTAGSNIVLRVFYVGAQRGRALLSIVMTVATAASVLVTGYLQTSSFNAAVSRLQALGADLSGIDPFIGSLLFLIAVLVPLMLHELGHTFVARNTGVPADLPTPIPAPIISPLGTFGAIIRMRYLPKRVKYLAELGISGPLIGVAASALLFIIFLATSPTLPYDVAERAAASGLLGYVTMTPMLAYTLIGLFGEGSVVILTPPALASMLILMLHFANLVPIGQLDGGHVFRSLTSTSVHRVAGIASFVALIALGALFPQMLWLSIFAVLAMFLTGSRPHIGAANTLSRLGGKDKLVFGILYTALLLLTFPVPLIG